MAYCDIHAPARIRSFIHSYRIELIGDFRSCWFLGAQSTPLEIILRCYVLDFSSLEFFDLCLDSRLDLVLGQSELEQKYLDDKRRKYTETKATTFT